MDLELKEKVALVTGASRGIGRAIARGLAAEGARVALCARDKATLETAAREIAREKTGAEPFIVAGDLVVNNAGAIRGGDFFAIPDAQWAGDWSLKLLGYIRMARAVFPLMRAQGGGRIVNVVGAAARNPTTGYLPGGVANAGLVNFTKGLADLGAPHGILATAVSPAATATERWEGLIAQQAAAAGKPVEQYRAEAMAAYPLKRIARPEDIADLVCFLASARASFLTGICITVDGGATRGVYL